MQILALAGVLALHLACGEPGPLAVVHTAGGAVPIHLELALTPEAQAQGLMYRRALADDHGMLFVFPSDTDHSFWMKNTFIPLDMIFIATDGRIVGVHANAVPQSTASITVGQPSRYVLEVPGGNAARRGIGVGDRVEFRGVPPPVG